MYRIIREAPDISHSGTKGMKWGYNDGKRNGRRTAKELNDLKEVQKRTPGVDVSSNIEKDYMQADHMLRFLGITLDAHSNDEAVVRSMAIYKQMADTKDRYKNQYDWLKTFTRRLSTIGYDMKAVDEMIDKNKSTFQSIKSGGGADADVGEKTSTVDLMTSYKLNKSKREAIKKHDKSVSKSKKKDKEKDKDEEETSEVKNENTEKEETDDKKKKKSVKHSGIQNEVYIEHHGILGQKWGVRRYQNKDGSLTSAGRKHYGYKEEVSRMSDSELRETLNRKRLENRYKELKVGSSKSVKADVEKSSKNASSIAKKVSGENSNLSRGTKLAGKVANDAAKLADKSNNKKREKAKADIDLSSHDTESLRKEVERMQMEKDLVDILKKETKTGSKISKETLKEIGDVLDTAIDVAALATFAYPLAKKALKKIGPIGVKYILLN